jgi:hypothetical protein
MKHTLIVLNEVGFVQFSMQGSQLLFRFCEIPTSIQVRW